MKKQVKDEYAVILFTLQDAIRRLQWIEEQLCEEEDEKDVDHND